MGTVINNYSRRRGCAQTRLGLDQREGADVLELGASKTLIVCCDGLKGLPGYAPVQTCVMATQRSAKTPREMDDFELRYPAVPLETPASDSEIARSSAWSSLNYQLARCDRGFRRRSVWRHIAGTWGWKQALVRGR
jgi:hypothetical protein